MSIITFAAASITLLAAFLTFRLLFLENFIFDTMKHTRNDNNFDI